LLAGLRQYVAAQRKRPPEGSLLKEKRRSAYSEDVICNSSTPSRP